jgi:hypothetical protein
LRDGRGLVAGRGEGSGEVEGHGHNILREGKGGW